jgi:CRISPR/Cas system-associated exonuclease Cas4 (RecB family)
LILSPGKYRDNRWQDYNQLLFYAIYFFEKYKLEKIVISFIYVEHNLENILELNINYLDNYKKELLLNIKTIEEDLVFCAKKSKLCDYCEFQELCE